MKLTIVQGGAMRLLFIGMFFVLTACHSGWDKDPLANENDDIKNAIKPDQQVAKTPPPEQDVLFVGVKSVWTATEGMKLDIPVTYKIAHPDVKISSVVFQNLEEKFPGATVEEIEDQKTGQKNYILSLTPGFDFVPIDAPYIAQPLTISFFNEYEGQIQEVKKTIVIHVVPQNSVAPLIEDVRFKAGNSIVKPGTTRFLRVTVKDTNKDYSPRIAVMNAFGSSLPGSQFIMTPGEGIYDSTNDAWEFDVRVAVPSDFYIPTNKSAVSVEIFAYSITGIPSRSDTFGFTIRRDEPEVPEIVAEETIHFFEKTENQYTFSSFIRRGNGDVTSKCEGLPIGARCDCESPGSNSDYAFCTISWMPDAIGTHKVKLRSQNKVRFNNKVSTTEKEVTIDVGSVQ